MPEHCVEPDVEHSFMHAIHPQFVSVLKHGEDPVRHEKQLPLLVRHAVQPVELQVALQVPPEHVWPERHVVTELNSKHESVSKLTQV